ncbi:universal stress protein [Fodinicurvata fenggangensis]|uniref:universal stress protein n=1 Tax=Fodinicurvata fenggangensis TaxID=1121830 RepID=UPI000479B132|nr:universal stress protein [Fodinicurvata fenggangensis]
MYRDILLAVDLDDPDTHKKALETTVEYAQAFGSTLHVISVLPDFGLSMVGSFFPRDYEKQALEKGNQALHAFVKEHVPEGISVQHILAHGTIYKEILHYAKQTNCDLIVMASTRPGLEDYLLGPNAARVVRHADCSVLVVRD